ncbi:MAG: aspartate aminotransferase family protein [Planctomycetes bacterium]|nr:aspartate aminotransferase family protein [Planctomycetota bacterium]
MATNRLTHVSTPLPGPKSAELIERWHRVEADTTGFQAPVVWDSAEGAAVTDVDGNRYIDWTSGVLVTNLGHCHPKLVEVVRAAAGRLINNYECPTESRVLAAEALVAHLPRHLDKCFFLTTGSEATEACIRIMKRKTGCFEVVGFHGSFHGRTFAAASVGGLAGPKRGYGPSAPGVIRVPYPYLYRSPVGGGEEGLIDYCMTMLEETVRSCSAGSLAGVMVEPYLGSAGFIFPPIGYLKALEQWARDRGILFALDEVQSSYGRTGRMWAMEWEDLKPDLIAIGKGIGNGIPTSAVAARGEVIGCLGKGEMSSTAGGNPVSCAAVSAVLEVMDSENIVEKARRMGELIKDRLLGIQEKSRFLGDVRGMGMVMGLELVTDKKTKAPAADLTKQLICRCAENGLLVGSVGIFGNVIRVAPPLTISEAAADESLEIMERSLLSLQD